MPKYLYISSYTAEGVKGLMAKGGTARRTSAEETAKSVGGKIESYYYAFGAKDCYIVADLPDNTAAAAVGLAVNASGLVHCETVVLVTPEEIDAAAQRSVSYRPPGG
jgi:uncharacterized protein with GYD domain